MIGIADVRALRDALGRDRDTVREHEPEAVPGLAGRKLGVTLEPADGDALSAAVRALRARGLAAAVRGGGTKAWLGNLLRRADVALSTARLRGVDVLDADEGVAHVRAGTRVLDLREAARAAGWEIALDPAHPSATLGGVVAAGEVGPRVLRFGRPRDVVLGLEVVLGSGERTRCGGRVVKNVTGYDLAKLYAGSLGTLGVIEAAWVRLRARPERERALVAPAGAPDAAVAACAEAARLPSARCAALADAALLPGFVESDPGGSGLALVIELAGDAALVEADTAHAAERGALGADARVLDALRAVHGEPASGGFLRFRVSCRRAAIAAAIAGLRRAGARVVAYPDSSLLLARFALDPEADEVALAGPLRAVAGVVQAGEGAAVLEAAPEFARVGRDVFGDAPASLPLLRALKHAYDPDGVLNPGRFVAGL